ncbi:MAG: hypothetical protein IJ587_09100 [Synergistaceae bacterium]|nr:hypothetical protein [Synergistaceae bacterium]
MITDYITHDEAMIADFIAHPDYAEELLHTVRNDGDDYEIQRVQSWYDEAKTRTQKLGYWKSVVDNAEKTAQEGKNLEVIIALMTRALGILKAAVPTSA